ncbi:hypothetical protein ScPMuIL_004618 [Solemya velum]
MADYHSPVTSKNSTSSNLKCFLCDQDGHFAGDLIICPAKDSKCEKFKIYFFGVSFELITDHKPFEVLYGKNSRPNARMERWLLKLMAFDFSIKYLPEPSFLNTVWRHDSAVTGVSYDIGG